jgi:hypothetical protein
MGKTKVSGFVAIPFNEANGSKPYGDLPFPERDEMNSSKL